MSEHHTTPTEAGGGARPAGSRSPRVRTVVYAAGAVSVAALALTLGQMATSAAEPAAAQSAPPATAVSVAAPLVTTITEWDEFTGRFVADESVEIRSRVSGYLTETAFEDGAFVKKGDLLFRIDPRPFKADLAAARADLERAEATLANARTEKERGERLVERQALSAEEADRRSRALLEAEADVAAAKARVDSARLNLEFTEIRAPITGRISDDFVNEGNLVVGGAQGGTLLTTIVSLDPIQFEFTASEADYLKYRRLEQAGERESEDGAGLPVYVRLMDESGYATKGELSFMDNQLDRSTGTIRGRATFDNPDEFFAPGMFGRLRLVGSGEYEAVMIPDKAIQTDQTQKFVWVAGEGDTAQRRDVTLGPIVNGLRVVRAGLSGQERLIVAGTQFVYPGAQLAPSDAGPIRFASAQTDTEGAQ